MAGRGSFILDILRAMRSMPKEWKMRVVPVVACQGYTAVLPKVDPKEHPHAFYIVLENTVNGSVPIEYIYCESFPHLYEIFRNNKKCTTPRHLVVYIFNAMRESATKKWVVRTLKIRGCGFASTHRYSLIEPFTNVVDFEMESKNE
jgi:hypothetical protein